MKICSRKNIYPLGPTLIKCVREKTVSSLKLVNKKHKMNGATMKY